MADKGFYAKLGLKDEEFRRKLNQSKSNVKGFANSLKSMAGPLAAAFSVGAVINFARVSAQAYDTQKRAEAKVAQAVKATGGAAGFTAKQLNNMASELQKVTTYGDEEILNKVTAQLLSFPQIAGGVFKEAQKAALDLATLLDGDLQSSSIALGKALADPVRGITAMRRMGVMFSEDQQEIISNFVEQNDLVSAQKLILQEINKQYGGQAVAAAQAGLGAFKQLNNAWGDFQEALFEVSSGGNAGPMNGIVQGATLSITALTNLTKNFEASWGSVLKIIGSIINPLYGIYNITKALTGEIRKMAHDAAWQKGTEEAIAGNQKYIDDVAKKLMTNGTPAIEAHRRATELLHAQLIRMRGEVGDNQEEWDRYSAQITALEETLYPANVQIEKTTDNINKEAEAVAKLNEELEENRRKQKLDFDIDVSKAAKSDRDLTSGLIGDLPTDPSDVIDEDYTPSTEQLDKFLEEREAFVKAIEEQNQRLAATMQAVGMAFVDAMGEFIKGEATFGETVKSLLIEIIKIIAGYLATSVAASFAGGASVGGPTAPFTGAAAAGAAIGLFGALVPALLAEGGRIPAGYPNDSYPAMLTSGETVVPPHKLGSMGGQLSGEFRIKGSDLVYIVNRESNKLARNR